MEDRRFPTASFNRLANISMEEAWGVLKSEGYNNQFEAGWQIIHPRKTIGGTRGYCSIHALRPDMDGPIQGREKPKKDVCASNSWPIDVLQNGDVYVADGFSKKS
jgi:hypothetical protein